jgi:hypothetical protein
VERASLKNIRSTAKFSRSTLQNQSVQDARQDTASENALQQCSTIGIEQTRGNALRCAQYRIDFPIRKEI